MVNITKKSVNQTFYTHYRLFFITPPLCHTTIVIISNLTVSVFGNTQVMSVIRI